MNLWATGTGSWLTPYPHFFYPENARKDEKGRDNQHTDNGEPQIPVGNSIYLNQSRSFSFQYRQ